MSKKNKAKAELSLQKGDFYMNQQGLMVFTEQYHKRRGYCCKNECLHCPWAYKRKK